MKKPTAYEWISLALCAVFLLCCALWLLPHCTPSQGWQVKTERFDIPSAEDSSPDDRPDSLLPDEIINLNAASRSDLLRLPNIGEVRADAILTNRTEHGPFHSVDELLRVPGIGPATLDALRPFISVE